MDVRSVRDSVRVLPIFGFLLFGTWAPVLAQGPPATIPNAALAPAQAASPAVPPAATPLPAGSGPTSENQAHQSENTNAGSEQSSLLKIGPGDLIELSVYNVPELNTKARVGNSGDIYLPLIDYVHVSGLTLEEAQSVIEKRLADGGFVRNPHVTIFVDESNSQGVTILGEVGHPGIYADLGDRKLYEMISQAGGFTQTAARKVSIARKNQINPIDINLPRNLADDMSKNVEIFPGDTILIPRAPIIYVVGDVGHPAGLLVDNGSMTVLQAIALAGGPNKTAKLGGVRILHKTPAGMTEKTVPLKKMLEAKAPDVTLQADDILFVPISGGRILAGKTFEMAMSLTSAVTLYRVVP